MRRSAVSRTVGKLLNEPSERDRLGAWVLAGVLCAILQKLGRLLLRSLQFAANSPDPFSHAFANFWQSHAFWEFWGDTVIQGVPIGIVGYILHQRTDAPRWLSARRTTLLVCWIALVEVLYFPAFVQYYPKGFSIQEFILGVRVGIMMFLSWDFPLQIALIVGALRLVPEVASGLEYIFTAIRERWLE